MTSFPCFLALRKTARRLLNMGATGFQMEEVPVTEFEDFREDPGLTEKAHLVVSEWVLDLLREETLAIGTLCSVSRMWLACMKSIKIFAFHGESLF